MSTPAPAPEPPAGEAPEAEPVELTEFLCSDSECDSSVWLPVAAAQPMASRPPCPLCGGNSLQPLPPPSPAPGFVSGSEDSDDAMDADEPDELDDIDVDGLDIVDARLSITRFIQNRLNGFASATAAALSLLEDHLSLPVPPASAASIAALPTVEVSDPDDECAICLEDLPLSSPALMLPCSHLYHSSCVVSWLQMHNSCPMCRSPLPAGDAGVMEGSPPDPLTRVTIRLTSHYRVRANGGGMFAEGPVSLSPTQLGQSGTGIVGGPANSSDTVSSEWPPQPDPDTVMSEARDGDDDFFY